MLMMTIWIYDDAILSVACVGVLPRIYWYLDIKAGGAGLKLRMDTTSSIISPARKSNLFYSSTTYLTYPNICT